MLLSRDLRYTKATVPKWRRGQTGWSMAFNLKLPDERGKQLQLIAKVEGRSVVDVITDQIRAKVSAGVIPADLPGVDVIKTDTGLNVTMPDFEADIPADEVPALVGDLRAARAKLLPAIVGRRGKSMEGMAVSSGIEVKGMAQGVRLISPMSGKEYPLAFSVAADLADQIERVAK